MNEEKLPTIRLSLGEDFAKIQAQSTYRFQSTELSEIDLIGADSPVIFEYTRPECQFVLPVAIFVSIDLDFTHAVEVNISPHLRYLTFDESLQLLNRLGETFERAGWERVSKEEQSWESLRQVYNGTTTDSDYTVDVGTWQFGDDEIHLTLERHWQRDEIPPALSVSSEDLFIVTINIGNDKILERYND